MNLERSAMESVNQGALYIVATPIGNLEDLSPRARIVLADAALIAAEDTRHTGRMLSRLAIRRRLLSLHEHNEASRIDELLAHLERGEDIALVSDAGTPLISDPGYALVRAARAAGIRVVPIPGPCALVAALSASGLPTDRFTFEGFLPAKAAARRQRLETLQAESRTLIFYEAIHRLSLTLEDLASTFGNRQICLARELTKLHETIISGCLESVRNQVEASPSTQRGEIVLIVSGAETDENKHNDHELDALLRPLLAELSVKQTARLVSQQSGRARNEIYARALALKSHADTG